MRTALEQQRTTVKKVLTEHSAALSADHVIEEKNILDRNDRQNQLGSKENKLREQEKEEKEKEEKEEENSRHEKDSLISDSLTNSRKENVPRDKNILLGMDTVLLIMCSNRPDYLRTTLEHVVKHHPRYIIVINCD